MTECRPISVVVQYFIDGIMLVRMRAVMYLKVRYVIAFSGDSLHIGDASI